MNEPSSMELCMPWKNEIQSALEESETFCIAIFNLEGRLEFLNSAMKALVIDISKESFLNPSFDVIVKLESEKSLLFEGILTIGNPNSAKNTSIRGKVFRKEDQILIVGEVDVKELVDINNKLIDLNNEINELQRKLVKAKKNADTANHAKSEFLTNMSHEIRTPLTSVIGFTELVLKTEISEKQNQYMEIINRSANSLLVLLNDLLDFSKIESGKFNLNIEKVNLSELVYYATDIIKYKTIFEKLELIVHISPKIPKFIFTDPLRLRQILINLLGNSAKFTKEGKIEIRVDLIRFNETAKEVELLFSVIDTGIGIPIENQQKIFDAFSQADSSTTRKYGGTGLGLTISNKLLFLMNSKLELESEYGKGSKFYFNLILKAWDTSMEKQPNSKNSLIQNNDNFMLPVNPKILVADDDDVNLFLTVSILKEILPGGIFLQAINGLEAIEKYKMESPDLILMDIQMPEMNGFEATKNIRLLETKGKIPIIAFTAGIGKEDIEMCLQAGMDDYTRKPIVREEFKKTILNWLHK